ncbi:hypothetical protein HZZ00_05490 [Streptomyces sp. NEAU-sy36]|uniref:hypothetical protein n=1 Tax=unclassified Streptomyces TaxID=2593676 RepID=UPI0015D6049C|nr:MULTISPECIES: hypothetical protein [unclassified Streptomyces]QLJ00492.1 hypothetical protein HZZ00_05490 [Streptomyces sp. NEAU-sy36]
MTYPRARRVLGASTLVVASAALLLSCSADTGTAPSAGAPPTRAVRTPAPVTSTEEPADPSTVVPSPGPEKVRDAFAVLQATYNDGCTTPGNCAYFLNRVLDNLDGLDAAMKADPQGPAHFEQPLAWIAGLRRELGDDRSFENLKKHQERLTGVRDRINAWMQGHPEDYR